MVCSIPGGHSSVAPPVFPDPPPPPLPPAPPVEAVPPAPVVVDVAPPLVELSVPLPIEDAEVSPRVVPATDVAETELELVALASPAPTLLAVEPTLVGLLVAALLAVALLVIAPPVVAPPAVAPPVVALPEAVAALAPVVSSEEGPQACRRQSATQRERFPVNRGSEATTVVVMRPGRVVELDWTHSEFSKPRGGGGANGNLLQLGSPGAARLDMLNSSASAGSNGSVVPSGIENRKW